MSATGLNIDLRDIRFVLFEQLRVQDTLADFADFADFDQNLYDAMLEEAAKVSQEVIAPCNKAGDVHGCTLDSEGNVTTPPGFKEAFEQFRSSGWIGTMAPVEWGGIGLPRPVGAAIGEMFSAANTAFMTYSGLIRGAAELITEHAPDWIKDLCLARMYAGEWAGTMCLTEAGAGSSVGDNRARATPTDEPGVYHLEGEKVFITAGDQDLTENILHLVLARTPGAPEGTKGISIFLVPKLQIAGPDIGARNDAVVVGIEEKMGIHGSATCTLALGANGPCRGYLLGDEHSGMRIMFMMMNDARIQVGLQGVASASAAYLNALSYARERIQGSAVEQWRDPYANRVTIVHHPDVRRMLMVQKTSVETMRSLVYTTAWRNDLANRHPDAEKRKHYDNLVELMTPIVKSWCSDLGFECTRLAVQTYGGYGYIGEYPVEQHMRDLKIASLYEGTNGIQAMDLIGRKLTRGGGMLLLQWIQESGESIQTARDAGLTDQADALDKAVQAVGATAMHLGSVGAEDNLAGVMVQATPFLEMMGTVVLGLHALEQARISKLALEAGASGSDQPFYRGKLLGLDFYVANTLPRATGLGKSIRMADESCLNEALFS
jgi:alkylation response protein AidB-like acyl-CoA dehydrogenase